MNDPGLAALAQHTRWALQRFEDGLYEVAPGLLVTELDHALEANTLLAIAKHAEAMTRVYALGFGCGRQVGRDRAAEFTASLRERDAILRRVRELRTEIDEAYARVDIGSLDRPFLPPPDLFGEGTPYEMTPRSAMVESLRHLAIHLGEFRLTRSLLERGPRGR